MNILIIHTAFIGDIVLSTALVAKLADKYPDANIYFLTTALGKEILKNNPKIKDIIVYDKRGKDKGIKAFFKFVKQIRKLKIDICLTPHRYLRSSILSLLSGAKIRIGYDIANLSFVFNKKIKYDKTKHEVEKLLSFVDDNDKRYELEMYPSEQDKIKIDEILKSYDIENTKIVISNDSAPIHITSAFPETKIIGIFGPTIKEFGFFPWSKNSKVFEVMGLSCRPCGIHGGNTCPEKHFKCMRDTTPDMIENEILFSLNGDDNE